MATRKKAAKTAEAPLLNKTQFKSAMSALAKAHKKGELTPDQVRTAISGIKLRPTAPIYAVPETVVEYRALRAKNNPRVAAIYRKTLGI